MQGGGGGGNPTLKKLNQLRKVGDNEEVFVGYGKILYIILTKRIRAAFIGYLSCFIRAKVVCLRTHAVSNAKTANI